MKLSDFFREPSEFETFCMRLFLFFQHDPRQSISQYLTPIMGSHFTIDWNEEPIPPIQHYQIMIETPFRIRAYELNNNPYDILKWDVIEEIGTLNKIKR